MSKRKKMPADGQALGTRDEPFLAVFEFDSTSESKYSQPVTGSQIAYLARLKGRTTRKRYRRIKTDLGLHGLTIPQLTRKQASRLIAALKTELMR